MAVYQVEHRTEYLYQSPAAMAQHVAHLCPRVLPGQRVWRHAIQIEPAPSAQSRQLDYFGNVIDRFEILRPHTGLAVSASSVVDVSRGTTAGAVTSPPWEAVRRALAQPAGGIAPEVVQFACPSPYVPFTRDLDTFTRDAFPADRPLLEGAVHLMHVVHERFAFDASATMVTTPLDRVFEQGRGVCQDFAHVAIACLRSLGLAARYVSGYLLTDPPPGQPRLVGADASHAWLSVYSPEYGWMDLDPTNNVVVGDRHVTVAWGRDYGDVSPLRGVLLGGAEHTLHVGVSVLPIEEHEAR